ncbi:UNVERIFIED_CONTAM: AP2 domain transcription factor AP2VIII-1 [Hammondia hammondi]|eukprot:XP_008889529.1 AP2 domain transcription factor AP2VIII-1 [Hammondia hammondi]
MAPDRTENWGLATPPRQPPRGPRPAPSSPCVASTSTFSSDSFSACPERTRRPEPCGSKSPDSAAECCIQGANERDGDDASGEQTSLSGKTLNPGSENAPPSRSSLSLSAAVSTRPRASPPSGATSAFSPSPLGRGAFECIDSRPPQLLAPPGEHADAAGVLADLRQHFAQLVRCLFSQLAKRSGSVEAGPPASPWFESRLQRRPWASGGRPLGGDRMPGSGESSGETGEDFKPQVAVATGEKRPTDKEAFRALASVWRDLCREPSMAGPWRRSLETSFSPSSTFSTQSSVGDAQLAWSLLRNEDHLAEKEPSGAHAGTLNNDETKKGTTSVKKSRDAATSSSQAAGSEANTEQTETGRVKKTGVASLPLAAAPATRWASSTSAAALDPVAAEEETAFHVERIVNNTESREALAEYANIFAPLFGTDPRDLSTQHGLSALHCVALDLQFLRRAKEVSKGPSDSAPSLVRTPHAAGAASASPSHTPKKVYHAVPGVGASPEQTWCSSSCSSRSSLTFAGLDAGASGVPVATLSSLREDGSGCEGEKSRTASGAQGYARTHDRGPYPTDKDSSGERIEQLKQLREDYSKAADATRHVEEILDIPTGAFFARVAGDSRGPEDTPEESASCEDPLFHFAVRGSQSDDFSALLRCDLAFPEFGRASPPAFAALMTRPGPAGLAPEARDRLGTQFPLCLDPSEPDLDAETPDPLAAASLFEKEERDLDGSTFQAPPPELPILDARDARDHLDRLSETSEEACPGLFSLTVCGAASSAPVASQCLPGGQEAAEPFLALPTRDAEAPRWVARRRDSLVPPREGVDGDEGCVGGETDVSRPRAVFARCLSPRATGSCSVSLASLAPFGDSAHSFSLSELFPLATSRDSGWARVADDLPAAASPAFSACAEVEGPAAPAFELPFFARSLRPFPLSGGSPAQTLSLAPRRLSGAGTGDSRPLADEEARGEGGHSGGCWLSPRSVAVLRQSLPADADGPESLLASLRQWSQGRGLNFSAQNGEGGEGGVEREARSEKSGARTRDEEAGEAMTQRATPGEEELRRAKARRAALLAVAPKKDFASGVDTSRDGASGGDLSFLTQNENPERRMASPAPSLSHPSFSASSTVPACGKTLSSSSSPLSSSLSSSSSFSSSSSPLSSSLSSSSSFSSSSSSVFSVCCPVTAGNEGERREHSHATEEEFVNGQRHCLLREQPPADVESHQASRVALDGPSEARGHASQVETPREQVFSLKAETRVDNRDSAGVYASDCARFVASDRFGTEQCDTASRCSCRDAPASPLLSPPGPPSQVGGTANECCSFASPLAQGGVPFSVSADASARVQIPRGPEAGNLWTQLVSAGNPAHLERAGGGATEQVSSGVHTPEGEGEGSGSVLSVRSGVCTPGSGSERSTTATQLSSPSAQAPSDQGSERGDVPHLISHAYPAGAETGERVVSAPVQLPYPSAGHAPGQPAYRGGEDTLQQRSTCACAVGELPEEQPTSRGASKKRRKGRGSEKAECLNPGEKWEEEARTTGSVSSGGPATAHPVVTIGLVGRPGGVRNLVTPVGSETPLTTGDFSATRVVRLSNKAMELPYVHGVRFEAEAFAWTAKIGSGSRRFLVKKHGFQKSRLCAIEKIQQWRATLSPAALERELREEREIIASLPVDPRCEHAPSSPEEVPSQRSGGSQEEGAAEREGRLEDRNRKKRRTTNVETPFVPPLYTSPVSSVLSASAVAPPDVCGQDAAPSPSPYSCLATDVQCVYTGHHVNASPELVHSQDRLAPGSAAAASDFYPVQPAYSLLVSAPSAGPHSAFASPAFSGVSSSPVVVTQAPPVPLPSPIPALCMRASPVQTPSAFPSFSPVSPPRLPHCGAPEKTEPSREEGREEERDRLRFLPEYHQSRLSSMPPSRPVPLPTACASSFSPSELGGRVLEAPHKEPLEVRGRYHDPSEPPAQRPLCPTVSPSSAPFASPVVFPSTVTSFPVDGQRPQLLPAVHASPGEDSCLSGGDDRGARRPCAPEGPCGPVGDGRDFDGSVEHSIRLSSNGLSPSSLLHSRACVPYLASPAPPGCLPPSSGRPAAFATYPQVSPLQAPSPAPVPLSPHFSFE